MKMPALSLLVLLALCPPAIAGAKSEARLALKKFGLAYCIGKYDRYESLGAKRAQGAYFQLGGHDAEAAYRNVRQFFDAAMDNQPAAASDGGTMHWVACLNLYESPAYWKVIKQQDKWIGVSDFE